VRNDSAPEPKYKISEPPLKPSATQKAGSNIGKKK